MKYRNLGKSGLKLSELSFGSWVTFNRQVDHNSDSFKPDLPRFLYFIA